MLFNEIAKVTKCKFFLIGSILICYSDKSFCTIHVITQHVNGLTDHLMVSGLIIHGQTQVNL